MSFTIPRNKVHEYVEQKLTGGGEVAPPIAVVGGAQRSSMGGGDKIFMVVNIGGDPALTGGRKPKTFHAASPGYAATKAFYSWWRAMRKTDESKKICTTDCGTRGQGADWDKLMSHLDGMEAKAEDLALFKQRRSEYTDAWRRINQAALDEALLVRLAVLGSKSNYAPRNYIVKYEPNTNPNWMEFWGPNKGSSSNFKPIVVNARARLARASDPLPQGVAFLERDLQDMP